MLTPSTSFLTFFSSSSLKDGIADVINVMDDYYLGTEDRDVILELGVLPKGDEILKKIPSATKTSFTKKYNTTSQ